MPRKVNEAQDEVVVDGTQQEASVQNPDVVESREPVPPTYDKIPYLNDDITFKDRESELVLLIQLLNFRRDHAIRELNYVQNCRDQRYYPGIVPATEE